jgi:hypothetical protein
MPKKAEDDPNEVMRQRLVEDAVTHRALVTAQRMERRATEKLMRREGGNDGSGRQLPRGATNSLGPCSSFLIFVIS